MTKHKKFNQITKNGLTLQEELEILKAESGDKFYGPFDNVNDLMKSLKE
jgi:hypothetical protein